MFRTACKYSLATAAALVVAFLLPGRTEAAFRLHIQLSGAVTYDNIITDENTTPPTGGTGDQSTGAGLVGTIDTGFITIAGAPGSIRLNFTVTSTASTPGQNSSGLGQLDIQSGVINDNLSGGAGTVTFTITLTDTGFASSAGQLRNLSGTTSGTTNPSTAVSYTYQGFADPNNVEFATTFATNAPTVPASGSTPTTANITGPQWSSTGTGYSLTDKITGTISNGAVLTFGNSTLASSAPVPASLILLASGAPVLGLGQYLRRRKTAKAS
jgi:hypothetical protein